MTDAQKTVRIHARLMINAHGKWAIYGWTDAFAESCDEVLYDMMADEEINSARQFWITAEVPIPVAVEIEGDVGAD